MAFEKIRDIIVEQLGVEPGEVTPDSRFIDDLGADSLGYCRVDYGFGRGV